MPSKLKIRLIALLVLNVTCLVLGLCASWKALFYTLLILGILELLMGIARGKNSFKSIVAFTFGGLCLVASLIIALSTHCLQ